MRRRLLGPGLVALAFLSLGHDAFAGVPRKDEIPDAFTVDEQIQGDKFKDLKSLAGRVVIVNVFTLQVQGDPKGILEQGQQLDKIWKEGKAKGLVVLGVSFDSKAMIQDYISKTKVGYPIVRSDDVKRVYEIKSVPMNLLISPQRRCVSYEGGLDVKVVNELLGQVKPEDLQAKPPIDEIPKGDYSKKFDAVMKQLKAGDFRAASGALEKLEKEPAPDGDNAKALAKWVHDFGQSKLEDVDEFLRIEDYMAAKDALDDIVKHWPTADDVVKTAKEKIASLTKDKNSDSARVMTFEKDYRAAQAAEQKGDKEKAIALYQKCADRCVGTKFAQKCKDRIQALTPPPAPAK